jgi:hypothetical protein
VGGEFSPFFIVQDGWRELGRFSDKKAMEGVKFIDGI